MADRAGSPGKYGVPVVSGAGCWGVGVPDHSTISQNRCRRFNGENVFRRLFERVLEICMEKGLVEENIRSEKMPDRKPAVPPYSGKHL